MARCRYDQCRIKATFNVKGGSKKPLYCKQHAEKGMVNVRSKPCSHESCTTRPSYNVEGTKTAAYCKQHAQDGMVNVRSKRCAYDFCMRQPSFNIEGSTTSIYCREHAEDGMVDVLNRRCLHGVCTMQRSFNVEGSKSPAYCKQHAEVGMVNIRTVLYASKGSRTTTRARCVPINVAATASDSTSEVVNSGKRLRREVDGKQLPHCLEYGSFQGGVGQIVGICPGKEVPHTSSSAAVQRHLSDDTVETAAKQTGQVMTGELTPLPDEHESGGPVKTEIELAVLL